MNFKLKIKSLVLVCFILITFSVFIAYNNPANGYEPSIYQSTPFIFWVCIFVSLLVGLTIIIQQVYTKECEKNNFWVLGFLIIIFCYVTILSLNIIRGYYMWTMSGDPASHFRLIQELNVYGFSQTTMYPLIHLYVTPILQILNVELIQLHKIIPLYFGLLYAVFMYLFAKSILPDKGQIILASIASCTLIQGYYLNFTPNNLSNLLFPMALFILVKTKETNNKYWKIVMTFIIFIYPPFHIVPSFALGLFLISLRIPNKIFKLINKENKQSLYNINSVNNLSSNYSGTLFLWGIFWFSRFYRWKYNIQLINSLIKGVGKTHFSLLIDNIVFAQSYQYNVLKIVFIREGGALIYLLLSLVSIPLLWKELRINNKYRLLTSLYGPLFIIGMFIVLFYFMNLGFQPLRMLFYVVIIGTIFTGFIGDIIIKRIRGINGNVIRNVTLGLVVVLLFGAFIIGTLKLYPSPYTQSSSMQTTKTEVFGGRWFFNNRDIKTEITGIAFTPHRFADFLLTPEVRKIQGSLQFSIWRNNRVYPHFGYDHYFSLSELYSNDAYLIITEMDKSLFSDVYPETAKDFWYISDFDKLENDWGVDKLYMNGGFDIWCISK